MQVRTTVWSSNERLPTLKKQLLHVFDNAFLATHFVSSSLDHSQSHWFFPQTRSVEFLIAFLFLFVGFLLYFPFVHLRYKLHFLDNVTVFLQRLMVVTKPANSKLWITFHKCGLRAMGIFVAVGRSVRPSVRRSVKLYFFLVFGLTAPAQMIWWPTLCSLPTHTRLG